MIKIYSKSRCSNCDRAKEFLRQKGVTYIEVNIEANDESKIFLISRGFRSVPQFEVDGVFIEDGIQGLARQSEEFFDSQKHG